MIKKSINYPNVQKNKYEVYEDGTIVNAKTNREIKQRLDAYGYKIVNLSNGSKKQQSFKVHRLVAYEFCPNDNPDYKNQVNHKNEIKSDNKYQNLEWCSHRYNINHGSRTLKSLSKREKPIILKNVNTGDVFSFRSFASACRFLKLDEWHVNQVLNGERKSTKGYTAWYTNSPVYNVIPVPLEKIKANDYNPNKVATPEMKLLHKSIQEDKYTQPIVCYYNKKEDIYEIVDGFHRYTTMKRHKDVYEEEHGVLPVVVIDKDIKDRMASTIRHNRARGTHQINNMSEIVVDLSSQGWDDIAICKHLGMELDEVIRLKQVSGLKEAFSNHEFSKSWIEFKEKIDGETNRSTKESTR